MRFKNNGYNLPKPLINVMGKPIIYWLLDNLINYSKIKHIIIPYNNELDKYNFEDKLKQHYNFNFIFFKIDSTRGATETIYLTLQKIKNLGIEDQSILSMDGDNFYTCDIINLWDESNRIFITENKENSSNFSFVKIKNNIITDIEEKIKISNNICTGCYGFESWIKLMNKCEYVIKNNITSLNEFYISTVIKEMIKDNEIFTVKMINYNNWQCLGTPLQVRMFISQNNNLSTPKRYCFDLDNTLVTYPKVKGDYNTVEPIEKNINFLRLLKDYGNTIIIYTARRMKTFEGNNGKILANIGKITFNTLEKFNIPYDEIYFGKPYADYYIDDLAISSYEDLNKNLGFYKSIIEPRSFNNLDESFIDVITKKSNDLSSEIFYYKNLPKEIKELFPILIDYDINNKWYTIEKIKGIPFSYLYLSELLTFDNLINIFEIFNKIHSVKYVDNDNINIYSNYSKKISKRYNNYNYSKFDKSDKIYNFLISKLTEYENNNLGFKSIIHGDPVLTNIILSKYGNIKMIDMRGKQDECLTLLGDKFYDWAKLYQSLIGYDEILEDKSIDINYKKKLILFFENEFVKKFGNDKLYYLKIITASLLFSLIPLHNNNKCFYYYKLIIDLLKDLI